MKRIIMVLLWLAPLSALAMTETLLSPNGRLCFTLTQDNGHLHYTLTRNGAEVVERSTLGVDIDNRLHESSLGIPNDNATGWCSNLYHTGTERTSCDTTWMPPYGEWATVWDDTRVLQGEIGEGIVTARRSGRDWFVGAMTGNKAQTVTLPLTFLEKGKKYVAHLYEDDPTLTTRTHVRTTTQRVTAKATLTLPLQPSGGAAIWLEAQ